MMIGSGAWTGLGRAGDARDRVVPARRFVEVAGRGRPHSRDDRQLFLESVEALTEGRERNAVRLVLGVVPARTETEVDTTARHLIDLGDGDREGAGEPERRRGDERAESDGRRLASDAAERHPRIGRTGQTRRVTHRQVVVAPEERAVSQLLGASGDGEEVVVGGPLLGLGEDAEVGEVHVGEGRAPDEVSQNGPSPAGRSGTVRESTPHAGDGAHCGMDTFAEQGRPVDEVIADLAAKRADDVKWRDGRTFGLVYDGGPSVHAVAEAAASLFLHENALNTQAFPSLRRSRPTRSRLDGRPAARRRRRGRVPHERRHRVDPVRSAGGPGARPPTSAGSPSRRSCWPNRRTPRSTRRPTTSV